MKIISKNLFFLFLFLLNLPSFSWGKNIEIPGKFNRDTVVSSLNFNLEQVSFKGMRRTYSYNLNSEGIATFRSANFGETSAGCSNRGGIISAKITNEEHHEQINLGIKVINENLKEQLSLGNRSIRADNPLPVINVEFNNNYYTAELDLQKKFPSTQALLNLMQSVPEKLSKMEQAEIKTITISEKRDFKSPNVEIKFTNSGNKPYLLHLPEKAFEHFVLRLGDGGTVPLQYAHVPHNLKPTLAPDKSLVVKLLIPKEISPSSGLVIYDNSYQLSGDFDSEDRVVPLTLSLCAILPNGKRATY